MTTTRPRTPRTPKVQMQPRLTVATHRTGDPYAIPDTATRRESDATFVPVLRQQVDAWRRSGYVGASETTRRLLSWWFDEEHLVGGVPWRYYFGQREAIETIIFCHEVHGTRGLRDLSLLTHRSPRLYDPGADDRFPRYCAKMATGSGKTKVMSMAIVWSYFHRLREPDSPMTTRFLLIAPNVIVYERLAKDFGTGAIFKDDPLIPEDWWPDFRMQVIHRDAATPVHSPGVLYLTNIHQLHLSRGEADAAMPDVDAHGDDPFAALDAIVGTFAGPKPKRKAITSVEVPLVERVASHGDLMVLNDEAHHVHDVDLAWYKSIEQIDGQLRATNGRGLAAVLDFSATPKDQAGRLFEHVIVDYPLATAIEDGIVKRPYLGRLSDPQEVPSADASVRYRVWLQAGVQRWRDYTKALAHTNMKPILFVMTEDTKDAEQVAAYLKTLLDLRDEKDGRERVLTIHTNKQGVIKENATTKRDKEELNRLRELANTVDSADSPIRAIVSVLMLREGWDVKNVTVIVGIRAFTAKAGILPEQAVGRGVRLMSPYGPQSGWDEQVDIIGTHGFERFVLDLEDEGVAFGEIDVKKPPKAVTVEVVPDRRDARDVELPRLTPALYKSADQLASLTLADIPVRIVDPGNYTENDVQEYQRIDPITREEKDRTKLRIPFPTVAQEIIAYWAAEILKKARFPGRFSVIAPLVQQYVANVLFGKPLQWEKLTIRRRLLDPDVGQTLTDVFVEAINRHSIVAQDPDNENASLSVAATDPFPWSGKTYPGTKTVFNLVACDNDFERQVAEFFDIVPDVLAYTKIVTQMRFSIEYVSDTGKLRFYRPDFAVRTPDGMFLVETKGREDADVLRKDERAARWCADATRLSGVPWQYLKIPQDIFEHTSATSFLALAKHARVVTTPVALKPLPLLEDEPPVTAAEPETADVPQTNGAPVAEAVVFTEAALAPVESPPLIDPSQFMPIAEFEAKINDLSAQMQAMAAMIEALMHREVAPQVEPMEARVQAAEVRAWDETGAALKPVWTLLDEETRKELVRATFLLTTPPPLLPGVIRDNAAGEAVVAIARAFERELHQHVTGPLVAKLQGERTLVANGRVVVLPRYSPPSLDEAERLLTVSGDLPPAKAFLERRFLHPTAMWAHLPIFISKLRAVRNRAAHGSGKPVTRSEAEALWEVVMDRKQQAMLSPFLPMLSD